MHQTDNFRRENYHSPFASGLQGYHMFRQNHVALRFAVHVSWRLEGVGLIPESSLMDCINTNNGYHAGRFNNMDNVMTLQGHFNHEPSQNDINGGSLGSNRN